MSIASQWKMKEKEAAAAAAVAKVGIPAVKGKVEASANDSSSMASGRSIGSKALEKTSKPETQNPSPMQGTALNKQGFSKLPLGKDTLKNFQTKEADPAPVKEAGQPTGGSAASKIPVGTKESSSSSGGRRPFGAGPKKEEPPVYIKSKGEDNKPKTSELNKETTAGAKGSVDVTKSSPSATEDGPFGSGRTKGLAGFWANQTDEVKVVKKKRLTAVEENLAPLIVESTPQLLEGVVRAEDPGEWKKPIQMEDGWTKNVVSSFQKRQQETTAKNIHSSSVEETSGDKIDSQDKEAMKIKVKDISQQLVRQQSEPSKKPKEKLLIDRSQGAVVLAENQPEDIDPNIVRSDSGIKEEVVLEKGRTRNLLQHWKNTEVEYNAPKTSTSRYQGSKPTWILEIEAAKGNSDEKQEDNVNGDDTVAGLKADDEVNINAQQISEKPSDSQWIKEIVDINQEVELEKAGSEEKALSTVCPDVTNMQHSKPQIDELPAVEANDKRIEETEQNVNVANDMSLDIFSPTTKTEVVTDLVLNQNEKIEEHMTTSPVDIATITEGAPVHQDYTSSLDRVKSYQDASREILEMEETENGPVVAGHEQENKFPNQSIEADRTSQDALTEVPKTLLIEKQLNNSSLKEEKQDVKPLTEEEIQIKQDDVHEDKTAADVKALKNVSKGKPTEEQSQKLDNENLFPFDDVKPKQNVFVKDVKEEVTQIEGKQPAEENFVDLASHEIKLGQELATEGMQQVVKQERDATDDKTAKAINVLLPHATEVVAPQMQDAKSVQSEILSKEVINSESLENAERIEGEGFQATTISDIEVTPGPLKSTLLSQTDSLEQTQMEKDLRRVQKDDISDVHTQPDTSAGSRNKETSINHSTESFPNRENFISLTTNVSLLEPSSSTINPMDASNSALEVKDNSDKMGKQASKVPSVTETTLLPHHDEQSCNEKEFQSLLTADDLLRIDSTSSNPEELAVDRTPCLVPITSTGIPQPENICEQTNEIAEESDSSQEEFQLSEMTTEAISLNNESNILPELTMKGRDDGKKVVAKDKQETKPDSSQRSCSVM